MTKHQAWITPDNAPGEAICRQVFVPSGLQYEAAFVGAFLLLCEAHNWEKVGTQEPQDVADAFEAAFYLTVTNFSQCGEGGKLIGEVFWFAGQNPPTGALLCDGQSVNSGDYPALYAAIGTTFGGDGNPMFAVPDLLGRMPLGYGQRTGGTLHDLGDTGGRETVQLIESELPAHAHGMTHNHAVTHKHNIPDASFSNIFTAGTNRVGFRSNPGTNTDTSDYTGNTADHTGNTGSTGSDGEHENMPPFLALTPCIQAL